MEFVLNIFFFIILPCAIIWDAVRNLALRCQVSDRKAETKYRNEHKKCFSSHDAQVILNLFSFTIFLLIPHITG